MRKYLISLIILACLSGLVPAVVSAQEGEGVSADERSDYDYRELSRDIKEMEREDERLWREIEDETNDLDERFRSYTERLENRISDQTKWFMIILAVLAIAIFFYDVWTKRRIHNTIKRLNEKYDNELGSLTRKTTADANNIIQEMEGHRERLKELTEIIALNAEQSEELIEKASKVIEEVPTDILSQTAPDDNKKEFTVYAEENPSYIYNADVLYEAVIRGEISDFSVLKKLVDSFYFNNDHEKAINILDIIISTHPDLAEFHYYKGLVLLKFEKYGEAVDEFSKALELNDEYTAAYNDKSVALFQLGRFEESLELADVVIRKEPRIEQGYHNKARALMKLGELDEAYSTNEKGIRINPKSSEGFHNKGLILKEMKQYNKSIKAFDEAIKMNLEYFEAYYNRGLVLYLIGKYGEAIESYDYAIEIKPSFAPAYVNKSATLIKLNRYDEAIQNCEVALKVDPNSALVYFNKACAYSLMGEKDKMLPDLSKAIELDAGKRDEAKDETDFDRYREDPDFRRLVYPEDFKEGEESG